jgi:hypothetical protein
MYVLGAGARSRSERRGDRRDGAGSVVGALRTKNGGSRSWAIAVEVVETVTTTEHGLDECVGRVRASAVAVRRILAYLTELAAEDRMRDSRWGTILTSALPLAPEIETRGQLPNSSTSMA